MKNDALATVLATTHGTSVVAGPLTLRAALLAFPDDLVLRRVEWVENTEAEVTVRRAGHAPFRVQILFEERVVYEEEIGATL